MLFLSNFQLMQISQTLLLLIKNLKEKHYKFSTLALYHYQIKQLGKPPELTSLTTFVLSNLYHSVKIVLIRNFTGPYFPTFRLDTGRYKVSLRIQSEWDIIRTRKAPNTDTFYPMYAMEYFKIRKVFKAQSNIYDALFC